MVRKILNDAQWARIAPELPGKKGDPGKSGTDNRLFVEAVLWVARTGSPWRDLPDDFGKWSTVYTRYWRWAQKDKWESIFKRLSEDADFEYVMIDGTIVRVHQHGAGARGGTQNQAIGRSRGGLTTKIAALVDALGNLVRFTLLPGQRHDIKSVDDLLEGIDCEAFLGDKAFDAKALRARLAQDGIEAVIPQRKGAAELIDVESRRGAVAWALWASLRFPLPAHQTGRADFPHPASRPASPQSTRRWAKMDPTLSDHTELPKHDRIGETWCHATTPYGA